MIKSDGGSSPYYDFPEGFKTLNDLMEWKADKQWLGDSFHLSNLMKAAWRWGTKEGTDKAYDARKIMYYGARLLMKYAGKEALNKTLRDMLDDEQFRPDSLVPTPSLYGNPDPAPETVGRIWLRPKDWRHL